METELYAVSIRLTFIITSRMKAVITPTMKTHPTTFLQQSLKYSPLQVAIFNSKKDYGKNTEIEKQVRIDMV